MGQPPMMGNNKQRSGHEPNNNNGQMPDFGSNKKKAKNSNKQKSSHNTAKPNNSAKPNDVTDGSTKTN